MQRMKQAISDILLAQVEPMSEFELIRILQNEPYELLSERALRGSLSLFQTHFLVFHCLYLLRDQWREEGLCELRIEPLAIACEKQGANNSAETGRTLSNRDPLRDYYLDLTHLESTTTAKVDALLNGFWRELDMSGQAVTADERSQAMMIMQLETMPETQSQLKRQFRQQVHVKHPDKGGSAEAMQSLQQAYQILTQALEHGISGN
ncbi:molecular chaperone DnaJ [Aliidiomarina minuta]|uniref:Molecular chaperone DnaJ n=1 Tax=Aliidiomarina minuta TaxID=880057 RepID=A0A432W7X9_9GAMM|nr:DNA-J related domain-containing protein [Aliidiomarina minuta]RUO26111.1 molecular chaperone DnaJ [Aliidiomarina minuta]